MAAVMVTYTLMLPLMKFDLMPPPEPPEVLMLNAFDMVKGPDGTIWTVGRQSAEAVELWHPLAGYRYISQEELQQWLQKERGRLECRAFWISPPDGRWMPEEVQRSERCRLCFTSTERPDPYTERLYTIVSECRDTPREDA